MARFAARDPEQVIWTFVSRLVGCFSSGFCSLELGGWVIRGPGLRGEVDTDLVAAERVSVEGMFAALL